ncbi:MAG: hypothetical protein JXB62_17955 [Pirellulales bacterium]|nr:hypothetical protein [Pirellulales bacterium]
MRKPLRKTSRQARQDGCALGSSVAPFAVAALAFLLLGGGGGCRDSSIAPSPRGRNAAASTGRQQEELFRYAIDNLNRLEEFNTGQMARDILQTLADLVQPAGTSSERREDPLLLTWPEPEMLRQIVNRLQQWGQAQPRQSDWKPDPMVAALPAAMGQLPWLRDADQLEFSRYDGFALREAVWIRGVSQWARGEGLDDLQRAKSLFDWTVRNIQLEADSAERIPQLPWETVLFGQGTAIERAWVFILLARQQGIDAALLAVADSADGKPSPPRPWAVAVLHEGELYVFDSELGLPIPAPSGNRLDEAGQVDIQPATLAEIVRDPSLLRRLDVEQAGPYPMKTGDAQRIVVLLEASPAYLTCRMKMVEAHLTGNQKMVLTTAPSAQAERFGACAHVAGVRLWMRPFDVIAQRMQLEPQRIGRQLVKLLPFYAVTSAPLRRGRLLHLKGQFTGPQGATEYYQNCRPSDRSLQQHESEQLEKAVEAARQSGVELSQEQKAEIFREVRLETVMLHQAKQYASYWLGLIAFQRQKYETAVDYFFVRTLQASPRGPWEHGARYNLARTYESSGQSAKAIEHYVSDTQSPGYHGNVLRARWLEALRKGDPEPQAPSDAPAGPAEVPEPAVEMPEPTAPPPEPAIEVPESGAPSSHAPDQ